LIHNYTAFSPTIVKSFFTLLMDVTSRSPAPSFSRMIHARFKQHVATRNIRRIT